MIFDYISNIYKRFRLRYSITNTEYHIKNAAVVAKEIEALRLVHKTQKKEFNMVVE